MCTFPNASCMLKEFLEILLEKSHVKRILRNSFRKDFSKILPFLKKEAKHTLSLWNGTSMEDERRKLHWYAKLKIQIVNMWEVVWERGLRWQVVLPGVWGILGLQKFEGNWK